MCNSETHKIFTNIHGIDISESDIYDYNPHILELLLIDHTMSDYERRQLVNDYRQQHGKDPEGEDLNVILKHTANITWATNDYKERGEGYGYAEQIKPEAIIGQNERVIMPRVLKEAKLQEARSKDKAEVFTPSWVCNAQNNLIDEAWFGRKDVFNQIISNDDGIQSWTPTEGKIEFTDDPKKTWQKYVTDNRMEITCGEAPYLISRYDTTTGEYIPLSRRIGLLDRKLRVVSENVDNQKEWLLWARRAFQHTYGYEWQGDSLLLAREALFFSFLEYFLDKFPNSMPNDRSLISIAYIVSWNLWQMDGLTMVVPDSCDKVYDTNLFGEQTKRECLACKKGELHGHIGVSCLIRDWAKKQRPVNYKFSLAEDSKSSPWQKITFSSLYSRQENEEEIT